QNDGAGVELPDAGAGNRITGNSIDGNGGLGIDLGADGVTPNDPGDVDTGPNDLQNYPDLVAAIPLVGQVYLEGALSSRPSTTYQLEYFLGDACNPTGHGEGSEAMGAASLTTGGAGTADIQTTLNETVLPGDIITATATDPGGSTSEFSACITATTFTLTLSPDSVVVTRGSEAKYAVDLTAVGGSFDVPVQLDCDGLPGLTECSFAPATVTPGAGVRSILTVTTTAPSASTARATGGWDARALVPALAALAIGLLGLIAVRLRRLETTSEGPKWGEAAPGRYLVTGAAVTLCLGLAFFAGCGDGNGTGPTDGGTPTGRYEFTVSATAGPLERVETGLLVVR
ncbi:MAG: hypothetical protein PVI01_19155, partial [Gemmatimonadales bacterium]